MAPGLAQRRPEQLGRHPASSAALATISEVRRINREIYGTWFVPDDPGRTAEGTLEISEKNELVLHLKASLGVASGDTIVRFPELRGVTRQGPICLISGFTVGLFAALGGPCSVHFHEALVGVDDPKTLFRRATFRVDGLDDFVAGEALSFSMQAPRSDSVAPHEILHVQGTYDRPETAIATRKDGWTVGLRFYPRYSRDSRQVTIATGADFELTSPVPADKGAIEERMNEMRGLIAFATGSAGRIRGVLLFREIEEKDHEAVQWVRPPARVHRNPESAEARPLLRLADVRDRWSEIVNNWADVWTKTSRGLLLFLGAASEDADYVDTRMFLLAQAAESYHAERFGGTLESARAFRERKERIVDSLTLDEDKKWLREKLSWANELTLRMRIHDLVDRVAPTLDPVLTGRPDYPQRLTAARNAYTHPRSSKERVSGAEHHRLLMVTISLLQASLLLDLGFSLDRVGELVGEHEAFRLALQA